MLKAGDAGSWLAADRVVSALTHGMLAGSTALIMRLTRGLDHVIPALRRILDRAAAQGRLTPRLRTLLLRLNRQELAARRSTPNGLTQRLRTVQTILSILRREGTARTDVAALAGRVDALLKMCRALPSPFIATGGGPTVAPNSPLTPGLRAAFGAYTQRPAPVAPAPRLVVLTARRFTQDAKRAATSGIEHAPGRRTPVAPLLLVSMAGASTGSMGIGGIALVVLLALVLAMHPCLVTRRFWRPSPWRLSLEGPRLERPG